MPNLRHLEYFHDHAHIEDLLFDGALSPRGRALRPDPVTDCPLRSSDAEQFRDYHLDVLLGPGTPLFARLGDTIGDYPPTQRRAFLAGLAAAMRSGETFLLGIDLVKPPDRLVAAYDDDAGVTAAFNRNVLPCSTLSCSAIWTSMLLIMWRSGTRSNSGSRCD